MSTKKKVRWRDGKGLVGRDDVVEAPDDASDDDIIDFLDGRRGKLKPKIVGPGGPNDKPDIVIGRNPEGDLQIDDYSGDSVPL